MIVNGSENKMANGARAPPNVTTRTKYTMAIALTSLSQVA